MLYFFYLWRETPADQAFKSIGWTPRPTGKPAAFHLQRRASATGSLIGYIAPDDLCGYIGGSLGAERRCSATTETCAVVIYNSGSGGVGCCGDQECRFIDDCVNSDDYYGRCDAACRQDTNIVKCTASSKPYCFGYSFPQWGASLYSCDSVSSGGLYPIETTFSGQTDLPSWSPVYGSASSQTRKTSSPIISSSQTSSSPVGISTSPSPSPPSPSPSPTDTGKTTPVGAIVGGVVGGLALIALVAGVIIFFLFHRKKHPQAHPPPPSGYPGQPHSGNVIQQGLMPAPMGQAIQQPSYSKVPGEYYPPTPEPVSPVPRYSTIQNTVPGQQPTGFSATGTNVMPQTGAQGTSANQIRAVNEEGHPIYQLDTSR